MAKHMILGVHVTDRVSNADDVQNVFSQYSKMIKTRLGINDGADSTFKPGGVIVLHLDGNETQVDEMANKLNVMSGVEARKLVFMD